MRVLVINQRESELIQIPSRGGVRCRVGALDSRKCQLGPGLLCLASPCLPASICLPWLCVDRDKPLIKPGPLFPELLRPDASPHQASELLSSIVAQDAGQEQWGLLTLQLCPGLQRL